MDFTYLFTNVSGRINRMLYWQGILILILASFVLMVGIVLTIPALGMIGVVFMFLIGLFGWAASVALVVKRLHDRGKSGHYAWLLYGASILVQIIDWMYPTSASMTVFAIVASLAVAAIILWFFIELGFLRGTPGPNAYGPDPLEAK